MPVRKSAPRKKCKARKNPAEENGEYVMLKSKSTDYLMLTCDFECLWKKVEIFSWKPTFYSQELTGFLISAFNLEMYWFFYFSCKVIKELSQKSPKSLKNH